MLGLVIVAFAPAAMAADTGYDTIVGVKAWDTWVDVVLDSQVHNCSGVSTNHFKIDIGDAEMIRLAETAWLSGKQVSLKWSCAAIGGGTNAKVSGVRAQ